MLFLAWHGMAATRSSMPMTHLGEFVKEVLVQLLCIAEIASPERA
jgi:hypothetical protein